MDNYRQVQDIGILRKKEGKEEELFVFGYSCKIYEDYDKSLYVDQGKHLIPWLGDETLKIDRYDCRGALNDLGPYLPKSEGFDRRASFSTEEKRIEGLCDQERYRALTVNEEEELLYHEEELKRLQRALNSEKTYGEVGFNYDDENKQDQEAQEKENEEVNEDEAFIPPFQLDVPVGMKIPKNRKHHEIIERTAFFINDQGAQMEILLKMKQAENPQFNFLSFDNDLHPYYRHMLTAIKNQRYKSTQSVPAMNESPKENQQDDTYLHPSLVLNSTSFVLPESAPKIPTINYKPSVDCTYSALVNRIKETQSASRESSLFDGIKKREWSSAHETSINNMGEVETNCYSPTDQNDEYSKSFSSLPLSALTKSARRRRIRKEKHKAAAASFKIYYSDENVKNQNEDIKESGSVCDESAIKNDDESYNVVPVLKPVPAPAPVIQIPSTDTQLIIDKMASYVAKNGHDFENVVRAKGDPRFSFLDKEHVYNPYYNQKVQLYLQLENLELVQQTVQQSDSKLNEKTTEVITKKLNNKFFKSSKFNKPIPICFSIKKPKDQETLEIKSALPYEESEREDNEEVDDGENNNVEKIEEQIDNHPVETKDLDQISSPSKSEASPIKKATDMTLEKWAQERLKAKLVTAAKEKLAAKDKDKQLQAERRKKAAEFINLLQKDNLVNKIQTSDNIINAENGKKDIADVITIPSDSSLSDSDSVVSVPLSNSDEEKLKNTKRKGEDIDSHVKKKKQKNYSDEKSTPRKSKHRNRLTSYARSPSCSRYAKYDKEKKSHSKKKKHHHYRSRSSSLHKKSHKSLHKSKRSKYSKDSSEKSDSSSSHISISKI